EMVIGNGADLGYGGGLTGAAGVQRQDLAVREPRPDGRAVGGRVTRSCERRYMGNFLVLQDLLVVVEPARQRRARLYRRERPRPDMPRPGRDARIGRRRRGPLVGL